MYRPEVRNRKKKLEATFSTINRQQIATCLIGPSALFSSASNVQV